VATTATRNGRRTNRSVADGVNTIKIGDNNVEYACWPARARVKAGTRATFINVGDIPHTATATKTAEWDTGALAKDESKAVIFAEPGAYFYICTPHPRMYGEVIVE
jgi:plastocyanin